MSFGSVTKKQDHCSNPKS